MIFTAPLVGAQRKKESVEKKPESSSVCVLVKGTSLDTFIFTRQIGEGATQSDGLGVPVYSN